MRQEFSRSPRFQASLRTPARRAKIAAAKRGKPRPKHVLAALRKSQLGKPLSTKTRRKMSQAHKRRGTDPPAAGSRGNTRKTKLCASCRQLKPQRRLAGAKYCWRPW